MEKSLDEIIAGKAPEHRRNNRGRREGRDGHRGGRRSGPIKAKSGESRGNCVLITNLHKDISEDDLLALFRSAGPITTITMEHGNSSSKGVAWVLYEFAADAGVAVGRYNNRSAAGQIIQVRQVERVGDLSAQGSLKDRLGGPSAGKSKRNRKGRGSDKKQPKTQQELDAELDSYMTVDSGAPASNDVPASDTTAAASGPEPVEAAAPAADDLMIE